MPHENFELRSELVQDIIGYIPHWITRWGITVIFMILVLLLVGSWIFRYPDVISSVVVVTTRHPPAAVVPKTGGKIEHLFVEDRQHVRSNDMLSVISSPADYHHVMELKQQLDEFGGFVSGPDAPEFIKFREDYKLGELQTAYISFLRQYADYRLFLELGYHHKKINSIEAQIEKHGRLYQQAQNQLELLKQQFRLSRNQYDRYSLEENKDFIAQRDIESLKSSLLQQRHSIKGAESSLENIKIQISELEKSVLDLNLQYQEQKGRLEAEGNRAYDALISQIKTWEHQYVLTSPIDGTVTFTTYWSVNQNARAGEAVMTVVPDAGLEIIGKVTLPVQGAGKVKSGQKVIIKLANYPHEEYGTVRGKVRQISLIPEKDHYIAEVGFPKGLRSSYGKTLPFNQEMQGTAEIVTEDIRLLERILGPVKSLLKRNVQ
ncbi:HlyD family secretion protein [Desulfonema magnum]|uniref:HylD family secretion domain-containing protein n=1 Tax=Desulfonema magnum TaxID=45655 RepID=A0A975BIQ9_9BACT|nr:HlyD family efflux transporter periplasmic adaptor subunit [Desulfonema magnum]QTA86045.1 HylD family secretion domain-containing protein [Desulfonema magnum]